MNKPVVFGLIAFLVINLATLFLPIELYDGEAVYTSGETTDEKLSLSYLINKEQIISELNTTEVVDLRLKAIGWILVFIVNFGLPLLIGYRVSIYQKQQYKE